MDLGDVTSVKDFRPIIRRAHSLVKAGSSCFYRCESSATRRRGASPGKNQRTIKSRQKFLPLVSAGMAELADAQDLGSCEVIRVGSTPTTRTTEGSLRITLVKRRLLSFYVTSELILEKG